MFDEIKAKRLCTNMPSAIFSQLFCHVPTLPQRSLRRVFVSNLATVGNSEHCTSDFNSITKTEIQENLTCTYESLRSFPYNIDDDNNSAVHRQEYSLMKNTFKNEIFKRVSIYARVVPLVTNFTNTDHLIIHSLP